MSLGLHTIGTSEPSCVAVVGLGLVGKPISELLSLQPQVINNHTQTRIDWSDSTRLCSSILEYCQLQSSQRLELIWTAGKAGFFAPESELDKEIDFFESTINQLNSAENIDLIVSLVSSAGGIYEHSGFVEHIENVTPQRPYAFAKLAQEAILSDKQIPNRVYRASTVFGMGGKRVGLIVTMLRSARFRTPMSIFADLNTLRDYIFNGDLARQIVCDVINNAELGVRIAACGRALSIASVIRSVQQVTNRRVLATFDTNTSNDASIVFSPNVVSQGSSRTSFEEGLRLVNRAIF